MASGLKGYTAKVIGGVWQGAGDIIRAGLEDAQKSYNELLTGNASISPPGSLTHEYEMVTMGPQPQQALTDAQLQSLVDTKQHEADMADRDLDLMSVFGAGDPPR